MQLRTIGAHEREAVLDLLGTWEGESRAHFARHFAHDPTFRDDLCFVAVDATRIVSTLQVLRRRIRVGRSILEVGGVGNVFTAPSHRKRRLATNLLGLALAAMPEHGFDLSLLFATRIPFYSRLGWTSHRRQWTFVHGSPARAPWPYATARLTDSDLATIQTLYEDYCATLAGTTVRDERFWRGQMHTAGNLDEDFLVARAGDDIVAYVRGTRLYEVYVVTEHAYRPDHAGALAQLIRQILTSEASAIGGVPTQLGIAPEVTDELRRAGHRVEAVDDFFWMWRVVDPASTAAKLGCNVDEVQQPDFFQSILPAEASVYWVADRF